MHMSQAGESRMELAKMKKASYLVSFRLVIYRTRCFVAFWLRTGTRLSGLEPTLLVSVQTDHTPGKPPG